MAPKKGKNHMNWKHRMDWNDNCHLRTLRTRGGARDHMQRFLRNRDMVNSCMFKYAKKWISSELSGNLRMMHHPKARAIVGINVEGPNIETLSPLIQAQLDHKEFFFSGQSSLRTTSFSNKKVSDHQYARKGLKTSPPTHTPDPFVFGSNGCVIMATLRTGAPC